MKKLLFIVPIFPKDTEDDTIVPFIYQFCDFFNKQYSSLEIEILTLKYPLINGAYTINGITVHSISGGFKNKLYTLITIFRGFIKGYKLLRKNKHDGILSFWYSDTALIGHLLKRFFGVKHYVWMQGQDVKSNNIYLKILRPKKDNLIVVGNNHNKLLNKYQKMKASKIANVAVVPDNFPELNINDRKIDIIGVGNLSSLKNYSLFVDIVSELKKTHKNINAIICGDGEEKQMLSDKVISLDLTKNIRLPGYLTNKKVKSLMNNSKILLHTSEFEGNSLVVQEALYSGCKVVSTIPLLNTVNNFYFEDSKSGKIKRINLLLNEKKPVVERVRHYKVEDTAKTIYSCFFDDT